MKIKDLSNCKQDSPVSFKAIVSEKSLVPTKNGGHYLSVALCDSDGRISFPIFEDADNLHDKLEVLTPYEVSGTVNFWNSSTQIKNISFRELSSDEYESCDFVSAYEIPKSLVSFFADVVRGLSSPYKEIAMEATGLDTDEKKFKIFLSCPSAEKHHGNKIGGLFLHTLGVMSNIGNIPKLYKKLDMYGDIDTVINKDRLMLKAILHDVMKVNEYEYKTCIMRKPNVIGHLYDGIIYLTQINDKLGKPLSEEELEDIKYSILSHHGEYGPCKPKTLEDMLLHLSDMIDSRVVGEMEK